MKAKIFKGLLCFGICTVSIEYAMPANAGNVVGDFSFQAEKHKQFADSFAPDSLGYLVFFDTQEQVYSRCSGTLIEGSWVLTSAHCGINYNNVIGAKFVTPFGEADMDAFLPHYKYDPFIPYAQSITKGDFDCSSFSGPCRNTPQQAIYDIALVHLSTNLEDSLSIKPTFPSLSKIETSFYGAFVGYGDQGSGLGNVNVGLKTLVENPTEASNRLVAATDDRLGGQNLLNVFNYTQGQVFISDFDNGTNQRNIDRDPNTTLNLEYGAAPGDSGSGVFEGDRNLVAIVSGGGYGNRANPTNPFLPFTVYAPPEYGSQVFYTPLAQHSGWLSNAIKANQGKTFTQMGYVSTNSNYSPAILPTGNLASVGGNFLLPDSMISLLAEVIVEPYSEEFNEAVWNEVFPSSPATPATAVPEPTNVLGLSAAFGIGAFFKRKARKLRKRTSIN